MACSPRAELWGTRTHWALRPLARAAVQWNFVRGISKSTVHRWLSHADLKPHRVRRWLHSPDPDFRAKVRRIVRLYLHPPRGTRVICADEKTQLQILEALHPARPMRPGQPMRVEQTYRRHGVLAILAGLDVRTGRVTALVRRRRRHQEFLALLQALRRRWPRGRLIVVVRTLPSPHGSTRRRGGCAWPSCRSMRRGSTRSNSGSVSSNANASSGPAPRPTLRWLIASPALGVSGIIRPGPFAGPSKAILSSDKWVPNLRDSALVGPGLLDPAPPRPPALLDSPRTSTEAMMRGSR